MTATVTNPGKLHGLSHAIINQVLAYFHNFTKGTFTILSYGKATAAQAATIGAATAIYVSYKGPGVAGAKGGTELFGVPGPEVGSGLSFAIAASLVGLFAYYRAKRSSAG